MFIKFTKIKIHINRIEIGPKRNKHFQKKRKINVQKNYINIGITVHNGTSSTQRTDRYFIKKLIYWKSINLILYQLNIF